MIQNIIQINGSIFFKWIVMPVMQESILPSLQVHEFPQAGHSIHNTDRVWLGAMGCPERKPGREYI